MIVYRHGDLLIAPVQSIPEEARLRQGLVLARGEATGHAHVVTPTGRAELLDHADGQYLRVMGAPARVTHEEHGPIELTEGNYRVWRQREYHPESYEEYVED